ncbi:MAG: AsmA-like C-terminal domain-containing protein [Deltaproteobacteria bacterium]|nr:AsmA-like C-terminal domain-containing protein [Deltaproteobacteria bacterium]
MPLRGHLRVKSEYFTYGRFTWRPFHADISFGHDEVTVAVTDADLCGISTPGVIKITPQVVSLDFKAASTGQDLTHTLQCVANEEVLVTGSLDFKGEITGRGRPEELVRSLRGGFKLVARNGLVRHEIRFEKVLALLNLTEIFVGKAPELGKKGVPYDSIRIKGDLKGDKLTIEEGIMDSPIMKLAWHGELDLIDQQMDFKVLVAPLKTVDRIVKLVPLVREILGGSLVSIPVEVKGDLTDPTVVTLSPSAVGAQLLGILTRTLTLPVKIVEPVLSEKKEKW